MNPTLSRGSVPHFLCFAACLLAACSATTDRSPARDEAGRGAAGEEPHDASGAGGGAIAGEAAPAAGKAGGGGAGSTALPSEPPLTPAAAMDAKPTSAPAGLPSAPEWTDPIRYTRGRGSAMLYLPAVAGAGDYRVYALRDGVSVTAADGGAQRVDGATIYCAGLRQHNQCDEAEAMDYGTRFHIPNCKMDARAASVTRTLLQQVQIDGLTGKTTVVVEAIDKLCPFPGTYGSEHADITCNNDGHKSDMANYQGMSLKWESCPPTFPIRTEAEIRADYGSLIINGHGPAPAPALPGSPYKNIALPAPRTKLVVLKRAVVEIEPLAADLLPDGWGANDFFESFSDPNDAPQAVTGIKLTPGGFAVQAGKLYQSSKLNMYTYAADHAQFFVSNGTLRSVMPDIGQGIMASNVIYPRRAFAVPDAADQFIHVTFETQTNATQRRYFWFVACGSDTPGGTIVDGKLPAQAGIVPQPSFMDPLAGSHISTAGWNCLHLVPRGGGYGQLAGGPSTGKQWRPETDIRVVQNIAVKSGFNASNNADTVFNMSPAQDKNADPKIDGSWMRQWDSTKKLIAPMMDDQMFIEQRTSFDVYFNRGRVVVFVDGVQKVCNDFTQRKLTMAEAAIGLGHVLYHSSAERSEFPRADWIRTAQYYYRYNEPFLDHRTFDNYGLKADARLPENFVEAQCFSSPH